MSEEQIEYMISRFLAWKLPQDFNPDGGISYIPPRNEHWSPIGTNLFTFSQAEGMVRYMIKNLPSSTQQDNKE